MSTKYIANGSIRHETVSIDNEIYDFRIERGLEDIYIDVLYRFAFDDDLDFKLYDAVVLTFKLRRDLFREGIEMLDLLDQHNHDLL